MPATPTAAASHGPTTSNRPGMSLRVTKRPHAAKNPSSSDSPSDARSKETRQNTASGRNHARHEPAYQNHEHSLIDASGKHPVASKQRQRPLSHN